MEQAVKHHIRQITSGGRKLWVIGWRSPQGLIVFYAAPTLADITEWANTPIHLRP
jgi:hypothetical protein